MKKANVIFLIASLLIISTYLISHNNSKSISIIHSDISPHPNLKETIPENISKLKHPTHAKLKSNYESHLLITNPLIIADRLKNLSEEDREFIWEHLSKKIDDTLSTNSLSAVTNQEALNLKITILNHSYSNDSSFEKLVQTEVNAATSNIKHHIQSVIARNTITAKIDDSSIAKSSIDACENIDEIANTSNINNNTQLILAKHNCYKQQERYLVNNNPNISDQELAEQLKLIKERTYTSIH